MRTNYWNCSKFANWIRGDAKPFALTLEGWEEWKKEQSKKHPIRFYISDTLLNKLQNIVYFPYDIYKSIKFYIINRFIDKTHYLKTGLKPGQFHEFDTRILYGLFNELVDFVEIENAAMGLATTKKKFSGRRNAQAGVDHLKWAASLTFNEDYGMKKSDKKYGQPTHQAVAAKEILELYCWWKCRKDRPDPHEISGWSEYCKKDKSDRISKEGKIAFNKLEKIEEKYEKEDDKMLLRLIKIRKQLWT